MDLYTRNALKCSEVTTRSYSTSFSLGIRILDKKRRAAIYAIYGFVRFADEIVDTFHDQDKEKLLEDFRQQTFEAIRTGLSTNPVLHSFQWAARQYQIDDQLIEDFLYSMKMDLYQTTFTREEYEQYIYGSAEVVGLMCLKVFCHEDPESYQRLLLPARKLGEAFQKVNFLRDMQADKLDRGRVYFPGVDFQQFDNAAKKKIEAEITNDFLEAYQGVKKLKKEVRLGVLLAYIYYLELLGKIVQADAAALVEARFRLSTPRKMMLLMVTVFRNTFNLV